jgi:hypothetical protein
MRGRRQAEHSKTAGNAARQAEAAGPCELLDARIETLRQWVTAQLAAVAALRARGEPTKEADEHLQALQRCLDATKAYRRGVERAIQRTPAGDRNRRSADDEAV